MSADVTAVVVPNGWLRHLMLRGLQSRPRAPASDEVRQSFVRLRQAKAPPDFIAVERYPSSVFSFN
jgi:hypothetical protein